MLVAPNLQDERDAWTPIHYAARDGHMGVVKLLLSEGAAVDAVNEGIIFMTWMHSCSSHGRLQLSEHYQ